MQKDVPPKKVVGNSEFCSSRQNHSRPNGLEICGRPNSLEIVYFNSLGLIRPNGLEIVRPNSLIKLQ